MDAKISSQKKKKECCIAWLDVSIAFGDIPHSAIFDALKAYGTGDAFVYTIQNTNGTTQVLSINDKTDEIIINRGGGVKQDFPLSGLPFNLAIDPSIRRIQNEANDRKILAFADYIALFAQSMLELQ